MVDLIRLEAAPLFALFGMVLASFGCVVADRVPVGQSVRGRSSCICGRQLRVWQLVPVLSWLVLHGRARCCGAWIPWRYPAAETVLGAVGAGLGWRLHEDVAEGHVLGPLSMALLFLGLAFALTVFTCWTKPGGDQQAQ
jgi:prepilin signal peptidase PulO-like enzyme (type II secretory pathway)